MLFLTFWKLSLDNFPTGTFTKRCLDLADARSLISAARETKELMCVSNDDLLAPYKKLERRNHVQLCEALSKQSIPISVDDFVGKDCVNILQFASVREGKELLVVNCHYTLDLKRSAAAIEDRLRRKSEPSHGEGPDRAIDYEFGGEVAPGSISFHLFSVAVSG